MAANLNNKPDKVDSIEQLLQLMWTDYCAFNPKAHKIYQLLSERGEKVLNDHIALRTFNHPKLGIESLAKVFKKFGFTYGGEYFFKEKKLYAQHFQHANASLPKIFISELELEKVSPFVRDTLNGLVSEIDSATLGSDCFSISGRPWKMSHKVFDQLASESEYAGWVAAWGFRPNHFTVNVNTLTTFKSLPELNKFLQDHGYKLNESGGIIKGTPEQLLEQSSTMSEQVGVSFSDGQFQVPACYYEFAKRYAGADGKLYQGFVASSADKIFESTNRQK